MRATIYRVVCGCLFGALSVAAADSSGQETPDAETLRKSFIETAKRYEMTSGRTKLRLQPTPLLNWTNPLRLAEQGALFAWFDDDLPAVMGTFFTYQYDGELRAKHELQSVHDGPIAASFGDTKAWAPKDPGVRWATLPANRAPGDSRPGNLTTMRSLAREFTIQMTAPNGEVSDLRLMPRPLLRFSSPTSKIVDGAIFSFAVATDPEALLLIRGDSEQAKWEYAFARFNQNRIEAKLDGKSVWRVNHDEGMMMNRLGDRDHMAKTYNSFHPEQDMRFRQYRD